MQAFLVLPWISIPASWLCPDGMKFRMWRGRVLPTEIPLHFSQLRVCFLRQLTRTADSKGTETYTCDTAGTCRAGP